VVCVVNVDAPSVPLPEGELVLASDELEGSFYRRHRRLARGLTGWQRVLGRIRMSFVSNRCRLYRLRPIAHNSAGQDGSHSSTGGPPETALEA
jgi:hypothetical protein